MIPSEVKIRLLTYNIHKCVGIDRKYGPHRVRETIAHHDPDIVLLQEVTEGVSRMDFHRQVDVLGDSLGFEYRTYFPNVQIRGGGQYGNAILSRFPHTESRNIDVTIRPGKRRSVLHARFRVTRDGASRTVHVYNAHLGLAQWLRDRQLRKFLKAPSLVHLDPRTPVILAGDFNDWWGNLGRKHLQPAGFSAMDRGVRTFPSWAPIETLDWVYTRGDVTLLDVQRSDLQVARWASDHLPLIAELKIG